MPRFFGPRLVGPWLWFAALLALGCGDGLPTDPKEAQPPPAETGSRFEASGSGTIRGRVTWEGPAPVVPPLEVPACPMAGEAFRHRQVRPNPLTPRIDARTGGLESAVVLLRGVDPKQAKPWGHSSVVVEQRDTQFHLLQDGSDSLVGFVRAGERVVMVSRDRFFYGLHARGAAYFTLMFPEPDQPLERSFSEPGVVELSSAVGCYWMRAHLFVEGQPYCTRTDREGRFVLADVPPGRYELVCWLPSWNKARQERDPESGLIARWCFERPVEQHAAVIVQPHQTREASFRFSTRLFRSASAH